MLYLTAMSAAATASRLALTLVLLVSVQSYGLIEASFALNRAEIAARYCVNRDRPELHCDGQCELARRLDAQHERESGQDAVLLGVALSATMWLPTPERLGVPPSRETAAHARPRDARASGGEPAGVFHPPEQA